MKNIENDIVALNKALKSKIGNLETINVSISSHKQDEINTIRNRITYLQITVKETRSDKTLSEMADRNFSHETQEISEDIDAL